MYSQKTYYLLVVPSLYRHQLHDHHHLQQQAGLTKITIQTRVFITQSFLWRTQPNQTTYHASNPLPIRK